MKNKRIIIMTAGTSLIENKKNNDRQWPVNGMDFAEFCSTYDVYPEINIRFIKSLSTNPSLAINQNYGENNFESTFLERPLACSLHIRSLNEAMKPEETDPDELYPDPFPAEMSSLLVDYFIYDAPCKLKLKEYLEGVEKDVLYLLCSDTPRGENVARFLEMLFRKQPFSDCIETEIPIKLAGVNAMDVDKFRSDGISSLAEAIFDIHDKHPDNDIILDITGGFKGMLAPAEALAHCLPRMTVRYLFEASPRHILIPALPLSFDTASYFEHRGALRALNAPDATQELESLRLSLPPQFQGLYIPETENNRYRAHPIGKKIVDLIEKMKADRTLPSPFGSARNFALQINDEKICKYRQYFEGLVRERQEHWYGDIIPETVFHERGHAQRLLELAFQLLMPLKKANPDKFKEMLPPWAMLVLLSTLWMHDVGHQGGSIKPDWAKPMDVDLKPFPSLVRDLHHYLGYERLKANHEKHYFLDKINIQQAVIEIPEINGLPLNQVVAICYLFHRKKIKLDGSTDLENAPAWKWLENAHKTPLKQYLNGWPENDIDVMKRVIALQRVIDASDVMTERAGDEELRKHKSRRLAEEIASLWSVVQQQHDQLKKISQHLKNGPMILPNEWSDSPWGPINAFQDYLNNPSTGVDIFKNFENLFRNNNKNEVKTKSDQLGKEIEPCLLSHLQNAFKNKNPLFAQYISLLYQLAFKPIQTAHYSKHAAVESTIIKPSEFDKWKDSWGKNGQTATFRIEVYYGKDAMTSDESTWKTAYSGPLLQELSGEFTSEVCDIFTKMDISFEGITARVIDGDWKDEHKNSR